MIYGICFVAAMVHDIGKLSGDSKFGKHENLRYIGKEILGDESIFDDILGSEVVDIIENHHNGLIDQNDSLTLNCIKLADRIQKSLHGIEEIDEFYKIKSLQFYPYYKYPITWEKNKAIDILKSISEELKRGVNVRSILSIQKKLGYYPHTRYIPHISLAIHHQLSAVLSFFLYQNLKASNLDNFKFYVVQVTPDQVSLFYRLRDVIAHKNIARELTNRVYRDLFADYAKLLRGIMPFHNQFVFYSIDGILAIQSGREPALSAVDQPADAEESGLNRAKVALKFYTRTWYCGFSTV
ncbi:MAG: HD domain-containing protein [Methanosarcinales archaeon]